jgi:hypothetical protein
MNDKLQSFGGQPAPVLTDSEILALIAGETVTHTLDFDSDQSLIYRSDDAVSSDVLDSQAETTTLDTRSDRNDSALAMDFVRSDFYLHPDFPKYVLSEDGQYVEGYVSTLYFGYLEAYTNASTEVQKEYIQGILFRFIERIIEVFKDTSNLKADTEQFFLGLDKAKMHALIPLFKELYKSRIIRATNDPIESLMNITGHDAELLYLVLGEGVFELFDEKLQLTSNDVLAMYIKLLKIKRRDIKETTKNQRDGLMDPYARNTNKIFFALKELYTRTKDPEAKEELMRMYKNDPGFTVYMPAELVKEF